MFSGLSSAVTVPTGFAVEPLLVESDWPLGHAWPVCRLEAIRNPDYGVGVIAASIDNGITDNGILDVMRISKSTVEIINSRSGFTTPSGVGDIRFDTSNLLDNDSNDLFVTVWTDTVPFETEWKYSFSTYLMRVSSDSNSIDEVGYYQGTAEDKLLFMLDFTADANDYTAGVYFADYAYDGGTSFYYIPSGDVIGSDNEDLDNLTDGVLPIDPDDSEPNRTDLDTHGMEFDRTGNYNARLTIADSEWDEDLKSAIYQLEPNLPGTDFIWSTIAGPNMADSIYFHDMCYDAGNGYFGGALYVTESWSESVMIVETNGTYTEFASGFNDIQSITIDESGEYMYVSDEDAVYKIWMTGPTIVMQEPKTVNDGVFTGDDGVLSLQLLWSEPITFEAGDVTVESYELGQEVNLPSLSGSGTEFMTITFDQPLLYDEFTVTIADTVVSEETGSAIDGDGDGLAGGDAVIVLEHRLREDLDNSNYIDMLDLARLAEKWLWSN
ncbi:MAG: hypothetical protein FVQ79_08370 [Planctomycetes bacterium]|nr:hypothetical protein [Planctomycetota bacterium]